MWNTRPLNATVYSDNYCASYKFFSIGTKRSLETNNSKKGYLPDDKRSWTTFSRLIQSNKPQGTFCKAPQGNLRVTVEVIGSFM